MKNYRKYIRRNSPIVLLALLLSFNSWAQNELLFTLYQLNPQIFSPAHAGSTDKSDLQLIYRNQWIGMEGAPKSIIGTANIKWKEKKGIGINLVRDEVGLVKTTIISGDFAYHTNLSSKWKLSGGIRGSLANVGLDFGNIALLHQNDATFAENINSGTMPNLGLGIRLAKSNGLFVDFSVPRLGKYNLGDGSGSYIDINQMFLSTGITLKLGKNKTNKAGNEVYPITLTPTILARFTPIASATVDFNLLSTISGIVDLGAGVRSNDSFHIRIGIHASDKYLLTYVYEKPTSDISKITGLTNEFGIKIRLKK